MNDIELGILITASLTIVGYGVTLFVHVNSRVAAVSERIDLKIDALSEKSSKSVIDVRSDVQLYIARIESRISTLERESVRKTDIEAMEARIKSQLDELKGDFKAFYREMASEVKGLTRLVDQISAEDRSQEGKNTGKVY
jgi:hypothetical protein